MTVASSNIVQHRGLSRRTLRKSTGLMDIMVLAGGPGPEREVSIDSGKGVAEALVRLGHRVTVRDVSPADLSALDQPADFVFIALHGEFGEDGAVQAELERRGVPYCGTGPQSSHLAMNKVDAKRCFLDHSIPTPEFLVAHRGDDCSGLAARIGLPAVVKPLCAGSSVDTSIEKTAESLASAAQTVASKYGEALVERYIKGPELTIGILGDEALPVCEIRTAREFYDYNAKYIDDDTQYLFDLSLPPALLQRVQQLALSAHHALGCEVFSRVDIMLEAASQKPFVLEVNTIPGFTTHSLLPKAAARIGISFDELCARIIDLSLGVKE